MEALGGALSEHVDNSLSGGEGVAVLSSRVPALLDAMVAAVDGSCRCKPAACSACCCCRHKDTSGCMAALPAAA